MLERFRRSAPEEKAAAAPIAQRLDAALIAGGAGTRGALARNPIAYRCARMIAEGAASVPLSVCENGAVATDAPLCALLRRPNTDETLPDLLERLYGHLQLHGDAYLECVRRDGAAVALYALRPDLVTPIRGQDGWTEGYAYRAGGRERRIVRQADGFLPIMHLALCDPAGGAEGRSPLDAARVAVETHDAASAWNRELLRNAARPSGAVIHRGPEGAPNLTGEQFDRLRAELEASFQGGANAGRPLVLDGGLDWQPLGLTPQEMDFVELKNAAARDIALAFGVPPQLLGIPGDNTYATYKEANLAFWRQTVLPLTAKLASGLTAWLGGAGTRVAYEPSRVDALSSERSEHLARVVEADFLTDAEKRTALGYPAEAVR